MFPGFVGFLGWSFTVGSQAQVAAAELYRSVLAGKERLPGERLDQGPVRQVQGRPGRLLCHADGQRVAAGVCGDRLGELLAQLRPATGVDEPSADCVRSLAGGLGWLARGARG